MGTTTTSSSVTSTTTSSSVTSTTTSATSATSSTVTSWRKLWDANFKNDNGIAKDEVSNSEFLVFLAAHLKSLCLFAGFDKVEDSKQKKSRELFARQLTLFVFWPREFPIKDDGLSYPPYVNKQCIQDAIDAWGPWSKMFFRIYQHLGISVDNLQPIENFWGRLPESTIRTTLKDKPGFLISYQPNDKGFTVWFTKPHISRLVVDCEDFYIFKSKRDKSIKIKYSEKIMKPGGQIIKKRTFESIPKLLTYIGTKYHLTMAREILPGHFGHELLGF